MATPRIAAALLLRSSRYSIPYAGRSRRIVAESLPRLLNPPTSFFRSYSTENPSKIYNFHEIKVFSDYPSKDRTLIDVREPHELHQTGTIPTSINIPISTEPDAFHITNEEFVDKFGVERPSKNTEVVIYCRSGVRSRAAAELARRAGWERVSEYSGSWLDWEKNGGVTK
ncbi:Rhodanese-like domain-containing protein [Calycina marina]|uniref:Rhodanese-like domain-containing protein n=1 Tax=Calycina marina TaxID=1763456 RepID=A0A9P8CL75_9HELO|nr:Rhodanese-like domain-containing protein [Calycina marina]